MKSNIPDTTAAARYRISSSYSPEDECFVAYVSGVEGCAAHGKTADEAIREARFALGHILAILQEQGRPLPDPDPILSHLRAYRSILNLTKLSAQVGIPRSTLATRLQNGTPFPPADAERIHSALPPLVA